MSLLTEVGKGLAGQWVQRAVGPASLFWIGGLAAWADRKGWHVVESLWPTETGEQVVTITLWLVILTITAAMMEAVVPQLLRFAEGYWPWPLRHLRFWLAEGWVAQMEKRRDRWETLVTKEAEVGLEPREIEEKVGLDLERARHPANRAYFMPTSIGNLLRAAESYPADRYGLDGVICWPRLWLLLPKEDREELATARSRLDQATILWGWGMLFLVFVQWSPWALPTGLLAAWLAWRLMRFRAAVYGDLLRAVFDLRRFALYDALRLARPIDAEHEITDGALLTRYLFRGATEGLSPFVAPSKSS